MPSAAPENAPVVKWKGEVFRLIPSRFPPINVYDGLISEDIQKEAFVIEELTNPRIRSLKRLHPAENVDAKSDPRLQNWNLAPFAYGNPDGSIFFGEDKPCLEVAVERQTALAVSVRKRQSFMEATQQAPIGLEMRMLCTPVSGNFWDLRNVEGPPPAGWELNLRRALGAKLPEGAQGILYKPVERPSGTCLALVTGEVLDKTLQTVHYRYVWDGEKISELYAFDREGTCINAGDLANPDDVVPAA
ncbi:MAG: RES family NAD+ phosphorylase [Alphaproteobacteria bacterium]